LLIFGHQPEIDLGMVDQSSGKVPGQCMFWHRSGRPQHSHNSGC